MKPITIEPMISVGLMTGAQEVPFRLSDEFVSIEGKRFPPGDYQAKMSGDYVHIQAMSGDLETGLKAIKLTPRDATRSTFTIAGVTIGIDFHWQRQEAQSFQGALRLLARPGQGLMVINDVPLESYLTSVISSEMSATCPSELLKAHAVISRSWVLAQLENETQDPRPKTQERDQGPGIRDQGSGIRDQGSGEQVSPTTSTPSTPSTMRSNRTALTAIGNRQSAIEIVRWYGRESHADFDVCADDHCQRYQGITKAVSQNVFAAIAETRGLVLTYHGDICDTRFSKCCGGMMETYRSAWEDVDVPYLVGRFDGPADPTEFSLPLTEEGNAERWILGSPPAYCNTSDPAILTKILPDFDQETRDFFRWEVRYSQDELREILQTKLGIEFGKILALEPVERGVSGRIVRLKIAGEKHRLVIGKELEIRRALSRSHLYSSAFVVRLEEDGFRLIGAGWGHGVGLCQIGAAVMAEVGQSYRDILSHYYPGAVASRYTNS
jgi:SpoIID/LytB domain protein